MTDLKTTIRGIPCIVRITEWEPYRPARLSGHPDSWCPEEGGYADYEILTTRGKPADWLVNKMTPDDFEGLEQEIFNFMEQPTWQ